jgi:predicted dehydrogenase
MAVRTPMRVGLVGCGNISDIYLQNGRRFRDIVFTACADINAEAAKRQAERYAIHGRSVNDLLKSDDVDIVLNLTIPEAHAQVSLQAIDAGKHVYSEKPLSTAVADGVALVAAAQARELRLGAAPDTVLGAGVQEARALLDAGSIGKPLTGLAAVMSHGMEHWHPNPGFFFRAGAGPVRHGPLLSFRVGYSPRSGCLGPSDGPDRLRRAHRDDARLSVARPIDQGGDAHQRPCPA